MNFNEHERLSLLKTTTPEQLLRLLISIEFPADRDMDPRREIDHCADRHARLAVSLSQEPDDMDTIGSLIDKLITVDMKMWHNQEDLYEIRRMTEEQFIARYGTKLEVLHGIVARCCDLNVQRSRLVDAIDRKIASAIEDGTAPLAAAHKTY